MTLPANVVSAIAQVQAAVAAAAPLENATLATLQAVVVVVQGAQATIISAQTAADAGMVGIDLDALTPTSVPDGNAAFLAEQAAQAAGSDLAIAAAYMGRLLANLSAAGG